MKLAVSDQFSPTERSLSGIIAMYGRTMIGFTAAKSGIENCTVIIQTDQGDAVARIYRRNKKSDQEIRSELSFMEFLAAQDLPVAEVIRTHDGQDLVHIVDEHGTNWQVVLMGLVKGYHPDSYGDNLISLLSHVHARMHVVSANYDSPHSLVTFPTELRETHFLEIIRDQPGVSARSPELLGLVDRIASYRVTLPETLPRGMCHLDMGKGNIMWDGKIITGILDFDDATLAPYIVCLAYGVWDAMCENGIEQAKKYVDQYESVRILSEGERAILYPVLLFRHYVIAAMHIAFGNMDDAVLQLYLTRENELLNEIPRRASGAH